MKPTRATLKAFIRKNAGKLFVQVTNHFDGMQDCCTSTGDNSFTPAESGEHPAYDYGVKGLWLVGGAGTI